MSTPTADADVVADPRTALPQWKPAIFDGQPFVVELSPMLVNVLDSLSEGKTNKAIGEDWGIGEETVKTHLRRLYGKIGARDRVHAVALAYSGALDVRCKPQGENARWQGLDAADYL